MSRDRLRKTSSRPGPRMGSAAEAGIADQRPARSAQAIPDSAVAEFLVSAATRDHAAVRRWVEHHGLHPDTTVGTKPTAICYAAVRGDCRLMTYLLDFGASVDTTDTLGMTPLHYAAMGGNPVCISLLVAHGAGLNLESRCGKTPLALAQSRAGSRECSDLLARYGASLQPGESRPRMFH